MGPAGAVGSAVRTDRRARAAPGASLQPPWQPAEQPHRTPCCPPRCAWRLRPCVARGAQAPIRHAAFPPARLTELRSSTLRPRGGRPRARCPTRPGSPAAASARTGRPARPRARSAARCGDHVLARGSGQRRSLGTGSGPARWSASAAGGRCAVPVPRRRAAAADRGAGRSGARPRPRRDRAAAGPGRRWPTQALGAGTRAGRRARRRAQGRRAGKLPPSVRCCRGWIIAGGPAPARRAERRAWPAGARSGSPAPCGRAGRRRRRDAPAARGRRQGQAHHQGTQHATRRSARAQQPASGPGLAAR